MPRLRSVGASGDKDCDPPMHLARTIPALLALALAGACAVPPSSDENVPDPYETQNRRIHAFNRQVDAAALGPAAGGYSAVPVPLREGVLNFSENILTPGWFVNNVLQGDLEGAGSNLFRFTINSTLGVGGIFDPASSFSLERDEADFGQTLYTWGVGPGAYVEVPLLGPWTQRDAAGFVVDVAINPVQLLDIPYPTAWILGAYMMTLLNDRTSFRESIGQTLHESVDSYAQTKDIYLQNRLFELQGGETQEYFDPYEDILE
jgi:phospholipid-binding lipoprotein MlaA